MVEVAVVIAAKDAASTIESTLRSVRHQVGGHAQQVIVVDDGSQDSTANRVRQWAGKDPRVLVVESSGGGPGAARNVGLDHVTTEWVTFLDADDRWDPAYLASVADVLRQTDDIDLATTSIVRFDPSRPGDTPQPPLRWRFEGVARIVDLDVSPGFVVPNVAGVFFRSETVRRHGLRFIARLRWSEDFSFAAEYLAASERRRVAVVPRAQYLYRVSPQGITATAWHDPGKYVEPFDAVYARLTERLRARDGSVPAWWQHALLYDLYWYMQADRAVHHPSSQLSAQERRDLGHRIRTLLASTIDVPTARSWAALPLGYALRSLLLLMVSPPGTRLAPITYRPRPLHQLRRVSYFYSGDAPDEVILVDGRPWSPRHAKTVRHEVFDVLVAHERILWVPIGGELEIRVDEVGHVPGPFGGEPRRQISSESLILPPIPLVRRLWRIVYLRKDPAARRRLAVAMTARLERRRRPRIPDRGGQRLERTLWLFHDRDLAAGDNAEHLYRHVAAHEPTLPIRFLLSSRSSDWDRLQAEGFHLVDAEDEAACGALWDEAALALLSDLSSASYQQASRVGLDQVAIVFLQHGVLVSDQSRWLNPKRIDLMLATTHEEFASVVGDDTTYLLTDYEVHRTGLPRHDALARALMAAADEERDLVLLAPTWSETSRASARQSDRPFWEAPGMRVWSEIGEAPSVRDSLARQALRLAFFVHPLIAGSQPRLWEWVEGRWRPCEDQQLANALARTHTVVTDYSSVGVEAALAGARGIRFDPFPARDGRRLRAGVVPWSGEWVVANGPDGIARALLAPSQHGDDEAGVDALDEKACARVLDLLIGGP